jgi:hypothetical protein
MSLLRQNKKKFCEHLFSEEKKGGGGDIDVKFHLKIGFTEPAYFSGFFGLQMRYPV